MLHTNLNKSFLGIDEVKAELKNLGISEIYINQLFYLSFFLVIQIFLFIIDDFCNENKELVNILEKKYLSKNNIKDAYMFVLIIIEAYKENKNIDLENLFDKMYLRVLNEFLVRIKQLKDLIFKYINLLKKQQNKTLDRKFLPELFLFDGIIDLINTDLKNLEILDFK